MPVRDGLAFVFFDVGATLVEPAVDPLKVAVAAMRRAPLAARASQAQWAEALQAMALVYGADLDACRTPADEAAFWHRVAAAGLRVLQEPPDAGDVRAVAGAFADYASSYRLRPGMRELLVDVRRAGLGLGIISNWPPSLPSFLRHHDLGPFDVLACSGALGVAKPDPAIFRWALARCGVPAARTAHVGDDHERDYLPALALGMHAVWLEPHTTAADVRRALGIARAG